MMKRVFSLLCAIVLGLLVTTASAGHADTLAANRYQGTNLVSDVPGAAAHLDPNLPSGYGPFGIQAINGNIFVTYAKQDPTSTDELHGPGLGFVDMFDP
ncbi:MAG: hypothetical protein M3P43_12465, partial [Actinomycetota bacterium]|nr:hypothetical protein [Actinomycetota bacterium]